jgi:hypothetical protein
VAEDGLGAGPAVEVGEVDGAPDGGGTFGTVAKGLGGSAGEVDEGATTFGAGAGVGADLVRSE